MAGENINQAELARVAALGQGKPQGGGDDPAGGENAMMELLTGGFNRILSMFGKAGLPGASLANSSLTTGIQAGLESKDGFTSKNILPSASVSGSDTFLRKILAALIKGGFQIKDLAEGISAPQNVSMADLGTFTPDYTPTTEVGRGSGIRYDV